MVNATFRCWPMLALLVLARRSFAASSSWSVTLTFAALPCLRLAVVSAAADALNSLPTSVRLSSSQNDASTKGIVGEYFIHGVLHGNALYRRAAIDSGEFRSTSTIDVGERFLFRTKKGTWVITRTESDAAASKGYMAMTSGVGAANGASPVGLNYRIYRGNGDWTPDSSFMVEYD